MRAYQQIGTILLLSLSLSIAMTMAIGNPVGRIQAATIIDRTTPVIAKAQSSTSSINMIPNLDTLVEASDLIVRARITTTECAWNDSHTKIETDSLLDILYPIAGNLPAQPIIVVADGGFIEEEDLGMIASHVNWLNDNDEVILFLDEMDGKYSIVGLMEGHFRIEYDNVINQDTLVNMPITDFLAHIQVELFNQNKTATLPENWQNLETFPPPPTAPNLSNQNRAFQFKNRQWVGADDNTEVRYKVNINSGQAGGDDGSAEDFLNAIISAAETWNNVSTASFTLTYDGPTTSNSVGFNGANEVLFMSKGEDNATGLAEFWFVGGGNIIEADIWLNEDHLFNANGSPDANEVDLHSVAMHEFGHWLALGHDDSETEAIMYAFLQGGTLKRSLHQNDMDGISFIYPCTDGPCAEDADIPAATSVPTSAPTSTPTSNPTATPTAIPTSNPTSTPTPASTSTPTPAPTSTPSATSISTSTPTPSPTNTSIAGPTDTNTSTPAPTSATTHTPTPVTADPTITPTALPTSIPTDTPTAIPISPNINDETPTATTEPAPTTPPTETAVPTETPTATPTLGPTEDPSVQPNAAQEVEISLGATSTLQCTDAEDALQVTLQIPSNAVIKTTTLGCSVGSTPSDPLADYFLIGEGFNIDAYQDGVLISPFNFIMPIEIVIQYTDDMIFGKREESLELYTWNEADSVWEPAACKDVTHDLDTNTLTVPICHLTQFALFAQEIPNESNGINSTSSIYLPAVIR